MNKACVFNTATEVVTCSKDYSELLDDEAIVSLHPLAAEEDSVKRTKHVFVTDRGNLFVDAIGVRKLPKKLHKIAGDQVWKSFQNDFDPSTIAVCQKKTTLQLWDVNNTAVTWHAKNLPHDDLELAIPIFDTGVAHLSDRVLAVSNGYG